MFLVSQLTVSILFFAEIFGRTGFLREHIRHYSDSWVVLVSGNEEVVKNITQILGFEIMKSFSFSSKLYRIRHKRHPKRSKYENQKLTNILLSHSQILWTKQVAHVRRELKSVKCPAMRVLGNPQYEGAFPDQLFESQWYLQECRPSKLFPVYDLGVLPVWYKYHIFGRNVKVIFTDEGVEYTHPDLQDNYDASLGLNLAAPQNDPRPKPTLLRKGNHGTNCAGIIAMRAGNMICGVGIAPLVIFGAVRLSGSDIEESDSNDATALSFKFDKVDIMSNSWGPEDDGKTMEPLGELVRASIWLGIKLGRAKKGLIFVFPAGNGRDQDDTCGSDGYVNSIYTIAIAGVDYDGTTTHYSERCAAVMATTYAGNRKNKLPYNMVTTDLLNKCSTSFTGTSAAVPVASGIITLLIEAKPDITWRGVQHAIAYTGEIAPMAETRTWRINAAGFVVGHNFGFGMLNALRLVEFSQNMETLPPMNSCVLRARLVGDTSFDRAKTISISFNTKACQLMPSEVNYIEHVQLMVSAQYSKRGAIKINLHSPAKTLSHMLESRSRDTSKSGLKNWIMDSVHMWGESPRGEWVVTFMDITGRKSYSGFVESVTLIIHGTKDKPLHYQQRRIYQKFTWTVQKCECILHLHEKMEECLYQLIQDGNCPKYNCETDLLGKFIKITFWAPVLPLLYPFNPPKG